MRTVFNPTLSPVVVDDDGHVVAGLAYRDVDPDAEQVKAAVAEGRLVWPQEPSASSRSTKKES